MAVHELPLERRTLHGHFSRDLEPVLTVEPGDAVRVAAPNSGWYLASGARFEPRDGTLDAGHSLAGPIEVRGALAGDTLAVGIDAVRPGPWGITHSFDDHAVRWELDGATGRGAGVTVDLRPFLGVLGMPPPETGVHSTRPPRRSGGNIDCKELVAGTTLFLPVPVDGGLFSAGDGHALQGDGEVSQTAIECPVEAQVSLDLRRDLELEWPIARIPGAWLTFGFDEDLNVAMSAAVARMLTVLQGRLGLGRSAALGVASAAVDTRVTQVVNGVRGVHCLLPVDAVRRRSS